MTDLTIERRTTLEVTEALRAITSVGMHLHCVLEEINHPSGRDAIALKKLADALEHTGDIDGHIKEAIGVALAKQFGVSPSTISAIQTGRNWPEVSRGSN